MQKTGRNSALVHLRLNYMTHFGNSRWHTDGRYWKDQSDCDYKLVTTLVGFPTMVCPWNNDLYNAELNFMKNISDDSSKYNIIKEKYKKIFDKYTKDKIFEGFNSAYTLVNSKYATYHSEPNNNSSRIFLAVLPGSKDNLKNCKQNTLIKLY
jgi:hypothetical protein